ncbi:hypothetical protein OAA62_00105 [bacterium]|nr:hypothetical protein [bacterium]
MIPLFKSHYSIGKSILTLNHPSQDYEGGSDSIFSLLLKNDVKDLVLVEDSLTGFLEARKTSFELEINLIFGLRICIQSFENQSDYNSKHKVIVFAKNDKGCKLINKIYSDTYSKHDGVANYNILKQHWDEDSLLLAVPFYDSFLYCNGFSFSNCIPDFSFCNPVFLLENNGLPTDLPLSSIVLEYCESKNYNTLKTKSIFYKNRSDLESYQTYKCICNRSFGKNQSLSNPGFDGLGSREFCFESYLENNE